MKLMRQRYLLNEFYYINSIFALEIPYEEVMRKATSRIAMLPERMIWISDRAYL